MEETISQTSAQLDALIKSVGDKISVLNAVNDALVNAKTELAKIVG